MQDWEKRDLLRRIGVWIDGFLLAMKILLFIMGIISLGLFMVISVGVLEGDGDKTISEVFQIG